MKNNVACTSSPRRSSSLTKTTTTIRSEGGSGRIVFSQSHHVLLVVTLLLSVVTTTATVGGGSLLFAHAFTYATTGCSRRSTRTTTATTSGSEGCIGTSNSFITKTRYYTGSTTASTSITDIISARAAAASTIEENSSSSSSSSSSQLGYTVEVVKGGEDDSRVVDVASFRNGLIDPQTVVDRAQKKRDSIDVNKSAIDGLKIGLLYVGPIIAIGTYLSSSSGTTNEIIIKSCLTNYGLFGGLLGAILAVNNYMGRSVHLPDLPEATNRIVVDLSEGLLRKQDMGFIALEEGESNNNNNMFGPTNGVIGAVDGQLRNSEQSPKGVRTITDYPSHVHIKNMEVHVTKRKQGIGSELLKLIIDHATKTTDAKLLTLEVEAVNQPAVQLYRKFGFVTKDNPNRRSKNIFMVKDLYN